MICGALQTLNEEAFEDVISSERPSPTGGLPGEQQQQLEPIRESAEYCCTQSDTDCLHNSFLLHDQNKFSHCVTNPLPSVIINMPSYGNSIDDTHL